MRPFPSRRDPLCVLLGRVSMALLRPSPVVSDPVIVERGCAVGETNDPAAIDTLADAIAEAVHEQGGGPVVLGLAESWLRHLVLETPPVRGLDALGLVQREIVETTDIEPNDLLFAETRYVVPDPRRKRRARSFLRVVTAARETQVLGLVTRLRRLGVEVRAALSAPAAALLRAAEEAGADGSGVRAYVLLRRDGLAILVTDGGLPRQLRVLEIDLPSGHDALARAVAEELRRSSVFFREQARGRDVENAVLLGRCEGDGERFAALVAEHSEVVVEADAKLGPHADLRLEAEAAIRSSRTRSRNVQPLLPPEVAGRRPRLVRDVATALLVCAVLGGSLLAARRVEAEVETGQRTLSELERAIDEIGDVESRRDELLDRAEQFRARRDDLAAMLAAARDPAAFFADLALSMPPEARAEKVEWKGALGREGSIVVEGLVNSDAWNDEPIVARLCRELGRRANLEADFERVADSAFEQGLPAFRIECHDEEQSDASPGA